MYIDEIRISGYRSVDDLTLRLGNVTVLVGANGCGKSNIYQAIQLVAAAATAQFARRIAEEGGMRSILWAGGWAKNDKPRVHLSVSFDELKYELEFGMIPISERPNALDIFRGDPDIKLERVEMKTGSKRVPLLERKRGSITARNMDGRKISFPAGIAESESVLSELREPHKFPELSALRSELLQWRFYHDFRTDLQSPLREPQLGTLTPILSHDGGDLAAALATINAIGDHERLQESIDNAFPYSNLNVNESNGQVTMYMRVPGVSRALSAREFSDGTLQYLCLLSALLSPRPAPFMVLNEPETSVHPDLFRPLADLILSAASNSQILLTTHSKDLARFLGAREDVATVIEIEKVDGATTVKGARLKRDKTYYYLGQEASPDEIEEASPDDVGGADEID